MLLEQISNITVVNFVINSTKLYVPVVPLSINVNIKFLGNINQGLKTTTSWNKYWSEKTAQPKNNNLDYPIDPAFRNIKLFILSFKNIDNDPKRDFFEKYHMPLVEIKDFNAVIDNNPSSKKAVKNKWEAYETLIEISINDDYTTVNILGYSYHQNYYKHKGIDFSRQTNTNISRQINFTAKLEKDDVATMFFLADKQQKAI